MDIQRKDAGRKRLIRRLIYIAVLVITVPLVTWGLSRLKPAAPTVERATVWVDTVKRGPMVRQVRGLGTLVAEDIMIIPAETDGRVEKRLMLPGVNVQPSTPIMVLTNPDLEVAMNDYEWQVKQAKANTEDLRVKLESQTIDQRSLVTRTESEYNQASLTLDRDRQLLKLNLKSDLEVRLSQAKFEELASRLENEKKRLEILGQSIKAQMDASKVQIEKLQAQYDLKKKQVDQLTVRAGTTGVLQELKVEVGQRVAAGTALARVAQPWKLKAELKIPETQAKDIRFGQIAQIDTRNGIIPGKVMRIDPAAVNGTVTVDVKLEGDVARRRPAGPERGWHD